MQKMKKYEVIRKIHIQNENPNLIETIPLFFSQIHKISAIWKGQTFEKQNRTAIYQSTHVDLQEDKNRPIV